MTSYICEQGGVYSLGLSLFCRAGWSKPRHTLWETNEVFKLHLGKDGPSRCFFNVWKQRGVYWKWRHSGKGGSALQRCEPQRVWVYLGHKKYNHITKKYDHSFSDLSHKVKRN